MARDIDQLIDAVGRKMLVDPPPMPAGLERAVRSRRRTVVIRRVALISGSAAAALGLIGGVLAILLSNTPNLPAHQSTTAMTSTPQTAEPAEVPTRAPTLGSFRAATRQGTQGAERATDQPVSSEPSEIARPFMPRDFSQLHR